MHHRLSTYGGSDRRGIEIPPLLTCKRPSTINYLIVTQQKGESRKRNTGTCTIRALRAAKALAIQHSFSTPLFAAEPSNWLDGVGSVTPAACLEGSTHPGTGTRMPLPDTTSVTQL